MGRWGFQPFPCCSAAAPFGDFRPGLSLNFYTPCILGLVLMLFLCMVDYHFFQKKLIAIGAYVLPLILLVMVFIPGIGVTDGGATRWIAIGSFNFQPSETMKIGW